MEAKTVSQYSLLYRNTVYCIVIEKGLKGWALYCNTLLCIATSSVGWEGRLVTIQTLYRDCNHLKEKGQGRALYRNTMRC